jgi:hypothetical protein
VPRLCEVYPGISPTTERKARKNLSQGSWRMPVGTMKTEYAEQSIQTIRIRNFEYTNVVHYTSHQITTSDLKQEHDIDTL